ncbi:DUF6233 domain-containing protein [Streptomyces sp. NPDC088707]|uniref:DUF6233 domain-containing protein n=1 Tax=Streptomyces sp. NPDC088707 TaxID=3365871 RepID=UPI00382A3633
MTRPSRCRCALCCSPTRFSSTRSRRSWRGCGGGGSPRRLAVPRLPSYRNLEDGGVEAAEYRVWVRAPEHVWPVDDVDYDHVPTESPPNPFRRSRRSARSSASACLRAGILAKAREGRGPARGVLHAPDCEEAPEGSPLLDVQRALDVAESPGTQLCTLCGVRTGADADAPRLRPHRRRLTRASQGVSPE